MKKLISAVTVFALITSLTACSTNSQKENTVVGAGTGAVVGGLAGSLARGAGSGWVIAAGAVVGGLVGGYLGHNMDNSDTSNMNSAMDKNSINEPYNWTNSNSGTWYKIVPTSGVMAYKGSSYCRHYVAYGKTSSGKTTKTKGVACRNAHGMWQQVR